MQCCISVCCLVSAILAVGVLSDQNVPDIFYPFGTDLGDTVVPVNDDGSSVTIFINTQFPFFARKYNSLYVNTNGAISFENQIFTFTPDPFPVSYILIAPYWCDVDTMLNNGRIYYRQSTDDDLLSRATQDVLATFAPLGLSSFQANWVFVATWQNVTYFGGSDVTPVDSFQAVLITDGVYSFTIFNYGSITWTTGTASGGDRLTGLGGIPAQVGFNAGDNVNYFAVPGSRTANIVNIGSKTNVDVIGRWLFRIDDAAIQMPGCGSNDHNSAENCNLDVSDVPSTPTDLPSTTTTTTTTMTQPPETTTSTPSTTTTMPTTTTTTTAVPTPAPTTASAATTGYDCAINNPCIPDNIANGLFYFPAADPSKFIECSAWGQCFLMPCPGGLVWSVELDTCSFPQAGKRRRRSFRKTRRSV